MYAGLIAKAQRVEHYEISGYGTAVRYDKELGIKILPKNFKKRWTKSMVPMKN